MESYKDRQHNLVTISDGRKIPREKVARSYRPAVMKDSGQKVLLGDKVIYVKDEKTGVLTRMTGFKMTKAEKKLLKRNKVKQRKLEAQ